MGDEMWAECVETDHATQVQTQLAVLQYQYCIFILWQVQGQEIALAELFMS
jgi:hypothetical protein